MENRALSIMKSFAVLMGLASLAGIGIFFVFDIALTIKSMSLPWLAIYSFVITFASIKLMEENPSKSYFNQWIIGLVFGAFLVALIFIV